MRIYGQSRNMVMNAIKKLLDSYPTLALLYRNSRDLLAQRCEPRKTPFGFTFAGHDAMASGTFEPEETKLVRKIMTNKDVLVNIGANVGYYCCHALSMDKPVIAVEPNNRNLHYLLKNIQNNGWGKMAEVFPVALGRDVDIVKMWGTGTGASLVKGWANIPESYVTQVPVLSLDRILGDTLSGRSALILVDVEGAEYLMLQGAQKTLVTEPRPVWMMEITTTDNQPADKAMNPYFAETFGLFFAHGYRAFTADEAEQEITQLTVKQVVENSLKLGTHNFLFRT